MAVRSADTESEPLGSSDPDYQPSRENESSASCFSCCSRDPQGDMEDGRTPGNRPPPETQQDLERHMRCEGLCCSTRLEKKLYRKYKITRCFCCFDCCFGFVQRHLVSDGRSGQKMIETEEWFRGFNFWPLPLLTLAMCSIETYFFIKLSNADNYLDALQATNLAWTKNSKYEIHRLVQKSVAKT